MFMEIYGRTCISQNLVRLSKKLSLTLVLAYEIQHLSNHKPE